MYIVQLTQFYFYIFVVKLF